MTREERLSQMAGRSLFATKPKKERVIDLILDLVGNGDIPPEEGAVLYSYFYPTIKKPKTDFEWLVTATADKKDNERLAVVMVEKGWGYATNSHVLHACKLDLEDGIYDVRGLKIDYYPIKEYPNVHRVIPDVRNDDEYREVTVRLADCKTYLRESVKQKVIRIYQDEDQKIYVDANYFLKMVNGEKEVKLFIKHDCVPIYYESGNRFGIIMPIKFKPEDEEVKEL